MTPITRSTAWIYGSVSLPLAIISYPLAVWIPRLYSTEIGIDLGLIGLVIFCAAIFDAISDPAMGFMSDRFQTRWGRRKPWIAIGVPIYAVAVWMLLNPDQGSTVLYLALFFILLRLATTILGLPYAAWGMELSTEYHTRTMIQSAREKYVLAGLIVASAIVLISEEVFDNRSASFVLSNFSWVIVTLLPLTALIVLLKGARSGGAARASCLDCGIAATNDPKQALLSIADDRITHCRRRELQKYPVAFFRSRLRRRGSSRALVCAVFWRGTAGDSGLGLDCASVWEASVFSDRHGMVSIIAIACFMLDYGQVTEFYVLFALKGFCFGAFAYLPRAMLADVVDFDTVRSGTARPASYFAILGFMTKCAASFGGLSLPILGLVGYSVARNVTNGPTELMWLGILYAIVPTLMFVVAFYLCVTWPLNAKLHQRLERLVARKQARYAKD